MQQQDPKVFSKGGMDRNSAAPDMEPNDYRKAINFRNTGTDQEEDGYNTNIESTTVITSNLQDGLNKTIGTNAFETIRKAFAFRYNSNGYHQILMYDFDTDTTDVIFEDLSDTGGIQLMPLDPDFPVQLKLINDLYLSWTDNKSSVGFANYEKLASGAYGVVTAEDISLIKPQNLVPIKGVYASDNGKAANFIKGKLFQFTSQFVGFEYTYSAWGTWSKRFIPDSESTPDVGTNVRANNCIIITVDIGTDRVQTINIAARSGNLLYGIIKSVDRSYVTNITDTAIDIATQVYEAYDPSANTYSFVFYNDTLTLPVAGTETDLPYDYVPQLAESIENINNNIIALGGITEGYERPDTQVNLTVTGYDPNITVPIGSEPNPVKVIFTFNSGAGSGLGNHVRLLRVGYDGIPHTGDRFTITLYDVRTGIITHTYTYTVPSGLDGQLAGNVGAFGTQLQAANLTVQGGQAALEFRGDPYEEIQSATIQLFSIGAPISKSIHALLDNSSYRLALSYRDKYGRFFPLRTDDSFIVKTPSFAQILGNTPVIDWTILNAQAPDGAVDYQWLITKNSSVNTMLDVLANALNYKGVWDAHGNVPGLAPNIGVVGDTLQIGAPSQPDDHRNLGNGEVQFNTGDYVVYNGSSWDVVSKNFGDLTSSSSVMVFKINPLNLFNVRYANSGINTILTYDFAQGDRCTLHYYIDGSTTNYFNNPCVNVQVLGYDAGSFLVKMEKSSDVNLATLNGKDVYLRLYSPKQADQTTSEVQNAIQWFEIGERFTITNGLHDTLSGNITDGDVYFKTRVFQGAVDPDTTKEVLATDFNFSDFYDSAFTSYGRPRTYNDELERTEKKASIRWSQNYVLGSKNNGLTRWFTENIYGEADGQTSSNYGALKILWQRNEYLVVIQELKVGYIPLNISILQQATETQDVAISEKLFNNIRYNQSSNIGIGNAKESFCCYGNNAWFIDPNRSEPIRVGLDGVMSIGFKMSKFFKNVLQQAYGKGLKIYSYYDTYYNEVIFAIQREGGQLITITFLPSAWDAYDPYVIVGTDVTATPNTSNSTASYNSTTGVVTYTPSPGFVGNNVATFTFNSSGSKTKNICLNWIAGTTTVNPFNFLSLTDQQLSTDVYSNTIGITGNTIAVPISISGGQYNINGGGWTGSSGTVDAEDVVQVRQTTSELEDTLTTAILTVSGYSADFNATTGSSAVDPFVFTSVTGQPLSTYIISNPVTISGNTIPALVVLTNCEYNVNGGAWISGMGTYVDAGDVVMVRVLSSSTTNTDEEGDITIGGTDGSFTVTTQYVNDFSFTPQTDISVSTIVESNIVTISGNSINSVNVSIVGGEYRINGGTYTSSSGTLSIGDTVQVRQTSSASDNTTTTATLTVLDISSDFDVTTGIVLQPFDFLVVRTIWDSVGGTDLDSATGFNGTGTAYDIDYTGNAIWVGYNPTQADHNTVATGGTPLYIQWAGDDTTSGVEAVLIDFNLFATDNPSLSTIQALIYTIWYGARGTGDIQIQLETYLGGTMAKVGYDFQNTGGVVVDNITIPRNVTATGTAANINNDQLVGTVDYDTATKKATLT